MLRLFIAINLPEEIKKPLAEKIESLKKSYQKINIRFIDSNQWHLTLVFLGYQPESCLTIIEKSMKKVTTNLLKPLIINFDKLTYGPSENKARMIWLKTTKETSNILNSLKNDIEKEFENENLSWQKDERIYQGHITLARFQQTTSTKLPILNESFGKNFEVKRIDLMKSILYQKGPEYEKLASFDF
jgi:2'-5' RNA ligase